ncbi:MAG: hypothetical protein FWF06_02225, partial [Symbiobacteriaceae bacterium]|nr:hypothetical protein [Symbiobacteriaceae bacterium]
MIRSLFALTESERSLVGDKALHLAWLRQNGLQVPDGFVIDTATYREVVEYNNMEYVLLSNDIPIPEKNEELARYSGLLTQSCFTLQFPAALQEAIRVAWEGIGQDAVIVRFSDPGTALSPANNTGRVRSTANIQSLDELILAIQLAWSRLWSEDAIRYRQRMGLPHKNLALAVLVQRFVPGQVSGLIFTANPRNNREDQLVIRSVWGLGESLVRDEVRPDHWTLDTSGAVFQASFTVKPEMRRANSEPGHSGTELAATPEEQRGAATLEEHQIDELLGIGVQVSHAFEQPQVIEWTYDRDRLFLLQIRALGSMFPRIEQGAAPGQKRETRAYFNFGAYMGWHTPLSPWGTTMWRELISYTLGEITKHPAPKQPPWIKIAGGRLWVDVTNQMLLPQHRSFLLRMVSQHLPGSEELLERSRQTYVKSMVPLGSTLQDPRWRLIFRTKALGFLQPNKAAYYLKSLGTNFVRNLRHNSEQLTSLPAALSWLDKALPLLAGLIVDQVGYAIPAIIAMDWIKRQLVRLPQVEVDLDPFFHLPHNHPSYEISRLLYMASIYYMHSGADIYELQDSINSMLQNLRHYGLIDLDPGSPRWHEKQHLLGELVEAFSRIHEQPDYHQQQVRENLKSLDYLLVHLSDKYLGSLNARMMSTYVGVAKSLAGWELQIMETLTQVIALVREVFLQAGSSLHLQGLLQKPEDIFLLTLDDLRSEELNYAKLIAQRRLEYEKELSRGLVPWLLTSSGEAVYPEATDLPYNQLRGITLTPGTTRGIVRVIEED